MAILLDFLLYAISVSAQCPDNLHFELILEDIATTPVDVPATQPKIAFAQFSCIHSGRSGTGFRLRHEI
jgi:hypothetical protein